MDSQIQYQFQMLDRKLSHVEDLCSAILRILEQEGLKRNQ